MAKIARTTALLLVLAVLVAFSAVAVQGGLDQRCYAGCYAKCIVFHTSSHEICKEQCEPLCDSLSFYDQKRKAAGPPPPAGPAPPAGTVVLH